MKLLKKSKNKCFVEYYKFEICGLNLSRFGIYDTIK